MRMNRKHADVRQHRDDRNDQQSGSNESVALRAGMHICGEITGRVDRCQRSMCVGTSIPPMTSSRTLDCDGSKARATSRASHRRRVSVARAKGRATRRSDVRGSLSNRGLGERSTRTWCLAKPRSPRTRQLFLKSIDGTGGVRGSPTKNTQLPRARRRRRAHGVGAAASSKRSRFSSCHRASGIVSPSQRTLAST